MSPHKTAYQQLHMLERDCIYYFLNSFHLLFTCSYRLYKHEFWWAAKQPTLLYFVKGESFGILLECKSGLLFMKAWVLQRPPFCLETTLKNTSLLSHQASPSSVQPKMRGAIAFPLAIVDVSYSLLSMLSSIISTLLFLNWFLKCFLMRLAESAPAWIILYNLHT